MAEASVQSTAGSRVVCISGSNDGCTMFRGNVKDYPLHSRVSPFTSPPVRNRVPSHFNWSLRTFVAKLETSIEAGAKKQLLESELLRSKLTFERGSS